MFSSHSTSAVEPARSFEYWRHLISDTFVPLTAEPVGTWTSAGRIGHASFDGLDVSTVRAGGQYVRRTAPLIACSTEAFVLASVQTAGQGVIAQDDRTAVLQPGDMAFYDSTRPYTLRFEGDFEQVVVQMPLSSAQALSGVRHVEVTTARTLPSSGVAGTVAGFFRSLSGLQGTDPDGAEYLAPAAGMLVASALSTLADGGRPVDGGRQLRHTQALGVLERRLHEPELDAAALAAAIHVSRRTLFRTFAGEPDGVMGVLRRMRVERAQRLLRTQPGMSVSAVAAACGFAGDVQFHRVFRRATGTTPAQYRVDNGTHR